MCLSFVFVLPTSVDIRDCGSSDRIVVPISPVLSYDRIHLPSRPTFPDRSLESPFTLTRTAETSPPLDSKVVVTLVFGEDGFVRHSETRSMVGR